MILDHIGASYGKRRPHVALILIQLTKVTQCLSIHLNQTKLKNCGDIINSNANG